MYEKLTEIKLDLSIAAIQFGSVQLIVVLLQITWRYCASGINRASLRIGTSAIHMPRSIKYSQAASTVTSVGNGIGPGTSA